MPNNRIDAPHHYDVSRSDGVQSAGQNQLQRDMYFGTDGTSGSSERRGLIPEQRAEIEHVKGLVRPWLQYYLSDHPQIYGNIERTRVVLEINMAFDKEAGNHPRQHPSVLVRDSIDHVKEKYQSNPQYLSYVEHVESMIKNIWSGRELATLQQHLTQTEKSVGAIEFSLKNWNGTQASYNMGRSDLESKLANETAKRDRIQKGIGRLRFIPQIPPFEELPSYNG